jgi:uncharacterized protein DUF3108
MVASLLAVLLAAPAPPCRPPPVSAARFTPGEQLRYRLDVLGADVGTFEVSLEAPQAADRARGALVAKSRARTSAFINTHLGRYEAFAVTLLGADLMPVRYREEFDEGNTHRSVEAQFPPKGGKLALAATVDGRPDPLELSATPLAREMLSTFVHLRALPLKAGQPVCAEVYATRKMWSMVGAVGPREQVETPLGRFTAVRIDMAATRLDDANVKRAAHLWVSDDDRRLPLVAIGEMKGKIVRAQLVEASGARSKTVSTKPERKTGAPRVGAAIGR